MTFKSQEESVYGGEPFELYRFTMGTSVWTFTSAESPKTFFGEIFAPETISHSSISVNEDVFSGQLEVTLPLQHEITKDFVSGMPAFPMWVSIWKQHEGLGDDQAQLIRKGRILKVDHDEQAKLTVRPNLASMRTKGPGPIYQMPCNWILYSPPCGAVKNWLPLQIDTYDPGDGRILFYANQSAPPDDNLDSYSLANSFGYKRPTLTGGMLQHPATGEMVRVLKHGYQNMQGLNYLNLERPFITPIANGDLVQAAKGCDRIIQHCRAYGRLQSFMGFPRFRPRNPFREGVH